MLNSIIIQCNIIVIQKKKQLLLILQESPLILLSNLRAILLRKDIFKKTPCLLVIFLQMSRFKSVLIDSPHDLLQQNSKIFLPYS